MDILIFRINNSEIPIITKLSELKDTTIYLAVNEDDAFRIARLIKPKITITGNEKNVGENFLKRFMKQRYSLNIFQIKQDSKTLDELNLFNPGSNKHIKFKTLLKKINKNQGGYYV